MADVKLEAIVAGDERPLEEVPDAAVTIGQCLGHPDRSISDVEARQRDPDALCRRPSFGVEDVGRDGRSGRVGHRYPPSMTTMVRR
jgi:hypothetical protein